MHIVHVQIHVKEEYIPEFIAATEDNALNSMKEAGVVRFDMLQQADDSTCFLLEEVYRSEEDNAKHWHTSHFTRWRDTVEKMFSAPRERIIYKSINLNNLD